MFWPDGGECCHVAGVSDTVPLAFLKDGGQGLRFRVRLAPQAGAPREAYIYLADARFCEADIIDKRYAHKGKEYIAVTMDVFPGGEYELTAFTARGERYSVEKTLSVERRGAFAAGGVGLRHEVEAYSEKFGARKAALWWEISKWFVAVDCGIAPIL
jgi:hypothetical protein